MHLIFSFGLWAMWEQDFGFGDLILSIKKQCLECTAFNWCSVVFSFVLNLY